MDRYTIPSLLLLNAVFLLCPIQLQADEHETYEEFNEQYEYINPFEEMVEGNGFEITDWLSIKPGIEIESESLKESFNDSVEREPDSPSVRLIEVEFELEIRHNLSAYILWEGEKEGRISRTEVAEKELAYEFGDWELTVGRFDLPFAEFSSYFITEPMVEFAETRADSLSVTYTLHDQVELKMMFLESEVGTKNNRNGHDLAYAIRWFNDYKSFHVGVGYLTDLAESDEQFLFEHHNIYQQKVGVISFFLLYAWEQFELTIESLKADGSFIELDSMRNQPSASNLEFTWYPLDNLQLALRVEQSDELEDAPEKQLGISLAWRPYRQLEIATEFLKADYKNGFVTDDDDNILQTSETVVSRIRFEF